MPPPHPTEGEARALFIGWEEMGPLLAYAPGDPDWQAIIAMIYLSPTSGLVHRHAPSHEPRGVYCCAGVPRTLLQGRLPVQLPPLPGEGCDHSLANAARLGVGLGVVCADVVESLNAILKRAYNDRTAWRGGGGWPGATFLEREVEVVLQI